MPESPMPRPLSERQIREIREILAWEAWDRRAARGIFGTLVVSLLAWLCLFVWMLLYVPFP